ncbi:MAG: 50S ribosomal protein L25 [Bryobacteraceae bacterium]|nr:50S ribosomal protein L25 [Bryobacteraceae bacterium]
MKKDITIVAEPRAERGKNAARRLRARGRVPAVLYGAGQDATAVSVDPKEIDRILHSASGHNTIFSVQVDGQGATPSMIIDWQHDPVKGNLLHADLERIDLTRKIRVKVPVHTDGEPRGVKQQGGLMEVVAREIEIECLPENIPEHFTVDVRPLLIGNNLRASDVALGEGVELKSAPDAVICHVVALRASETAAAEPGAAPAPAEPEVIKKGKGEEKEE